MKNDDVFYSTALLLHVAVGILFFFIPFLGMIYGALVLLVGIGYVVNSRNRNHEVLMMAAYCMGLEVYFRMIGAVIFYEYGKYSVILFMLIGIFYNGFSKGAFLYVFFIALLLPGIFIGAQTLTFDVNIRKAIAFNISGPICLAISSIYCFKTPIKMIRILDVLAFFCFPIVALVVHLFLFAPSIQEVVKGTGSNYGTSGGFGPNQVATVLGLAMFAVFARLLLVSSTRKMQLINGFLVLVFAYRCMITFSRGGMFTGLAMIIIFLIVIYSVLSLKAKGKLLLIIGLTIAAGLLIFIYSSIQTGGMIDKRYANENAQGVEKSSLLTGREVLMDSEFNMFLQNPFLGVGVGRNVGIRLEETGIGLVTHSEITRMLAEHGSLGIIGLLILFCTPIVLYLNDRTQIFAIIFMIFWLLTINHAAMRIAAPAFVYGLALLKVRFKEPVQEDFLTPALSEGEDEEF